MKIYQLFILAVLFGTNGYAQKNIDVSISDIKEKRMLDPDDSNIELELEIKGLKVDEKNLIRIDNIKKAKDNLGNELSRRIHIWDDYVDKSKISFELDAPSRDAKQIDVVEGTIKYFSPTVQNKGLINIKDIKKHYNENFFKGIDNKLKLVLIDAEKLKDLKEKNRATFKTKMNEIKGISKEDDSMIQAFESLFEVFTEFDDNQEKMGFYYEDPDERIISIDVFNAEGEKINSGSNTSPTEHSKTVYLYEPLKDNFSIQIKVESSGSIKEYSFKLNNIKLP